MRSCMCASHTVSNSSLKGKTAGTIKKVICLKNGSINGQRKHSLHRLKLMEHYPLKNVKNLTVLLDNYAGKQLS
jgi:hypothetical protein